MFTDVLILAGGVGERLWPASTIEKPKQFIRLFGGVSFFQETLRRAFLLDVPGKIIIITRKNWIHLVLEDIQALMETDTGDKKIPPDKLVVIGEPCGKNTAPALALVSRYLLDARKNNAESDVPNVLVFPSDHIITGMDNFLADVETASGFSAQNNIIVFGIPPHSPETGFGYMEAGESTDNKEVYKIASFKEKPDANTAAEYVSSGAYYWNSGIYGFRADFYLRELSEYAPDVFRAFDINTKDIQADNNGYAYILRDSDIIDTAYKNAPSISIDYAVSEKSEKVVMVKAAFGWDDAGTWDSVSKYEEAAFGLFGETDSKNNFVCSDVPVALCGVENLCVIIKNGRALVMKKGHGNEIKKILEKGV
ncbi:MAG: mannose-1-phosphate guanylyltransferase [Spirochaetaceae bacterium]|nr:mannose-1-phosphate guanylyltransferase [Spirochaetaceae bacterium]